MSTCPDKELFSAYVDDEVPSPWKEQLDRHLAECVVCRKIYDRYIAVRKCMNTSTCKGKAIDFSRSFLHLSARRDAVLLLKRHAQKEYVLKNKISWLYTSIRVPIPLAVAAVLLFVFIPIGLFFNIKKTAVTAKMSFKPIIPVSLEKRRHLSEIDFHILHSNDVPTYDDPCGAIIVNTKLFTVSDFTRLYINGCEDFLAMPQKLEIAIPVLQHSGLPEYYGAPEIQTTRVPIFESR